MALENNFIDKINLKTMSGRRFLLIAIVIMATLCMVALNVSAGISPDLVQEELEPGECFTVIKTVEIPIIPPEVDVVFTFDLTASMGDILSTAKLQAEDIMNTLINSYSEVSFTFGVISYMDYPDTYSSCSYSSTYGSSGDYAYSLDQPLTNDTTAVATAINNLSLGDGRDLPEDYTRIFYESYADSTIGWNEGAKKLLVNFADSVPHDCNLNENITSGTWSTGGDPGRDEIINNDDDLDLQDVLASMDLNGIILLECHTTDSYQEYWEYWTNITGGGFYLTSSSTLVDDVVNAIIDGLTVQKVYNLHLKVTTPGFESWLTSVVPPLYAEVESDTSVTFEETICVPEGTVEDVYTFVISAVDEDGVSYGEETNVITVIVNDPPVVSDIPDQTIDEGSTFSTINLDDYVYDPDNSDDEMIWTYNGNNQLTVSIDANRIATIGIPDPDWYGQETIVFRATDPGNLWDQDAATFNVTAVNDPPVITTEEDTTAVEDELYSVDYEATDYEGDTLTWSLDTNATFLSITSDTGVLSGTPVNADVGSYWVNVSVDDGNGGSDFSNFTLTVINVNDPPDTPSNPSPANGATDVILNPTLSVYVSDPDGDTMEVSFYNAADDSLIGTASALTNSTASVTWSGRGYSTTYGWYAIANDSLLDNKSDPWSFTTKSGGGSDPPPSYYSPTADPNGPYYGFVDEEIEFDGTNSKDNDENGVSIVRYDWKFFDEDTWHDDLGANPNHTYEAKGEYTVTLRVTDDEGEIDTDTATVYITTPNNPPIQPTLDGPTFGHKQTPLDYDVVSIDPDNDTIRYVFDWGDDTNTTTEYFTNGTTATQNHSWPTYGEYLITAYAEDINNATSAITTYTILIDVHLIDDEIKGKLIDLNSNNTWDVFYNDATGNQTDVERENNTYLIDSDGNGKWDYAYNPETGLTLYCTYVYNKYYDIYETPGFELVSALATIAIVLIILRRRRKNR